MSKAQGVNGFPWCKNTPGRDLPL